jgi:hypothetical protein
MKRINSLVQNLASIAPKAAPLAIVVIGLFAASPMAFAQSCSFTWTHSTVIANPGASIPGPAGTINGISTGVYIETFTESGNFTLQNVSVGYNGTGVPATATVGLPQSPFNVSLTATVPPSATAGETAQVTFTLYDILGQEICTSTVTVVVGPVCPA